MRRSSKIIYLCYCTYQITIKTRRYKRTGVMFKLKFLKLLIYRAQARYVSVRLERVF